MKIYVAGIWIVGIIQFLYILRGVKVPSTPAQKPPNLSGLNLPTALIGSAVLCVFAGLFWPVTVWVWLSGSGSPANKGADPALQEQQRQAREAAKNEEVRRRDEAAAAQALAAEQTARVLWAAYYSMFDERHVSTMSGAEFERFVGKLYTRLGYSASLTAAGADQGADLILTKDGRRIALQAKRWASPVGNSAVQEVMAGKLYYGCSEAIIVTTSRFTRSAQDLAARDPTISLVDGRELSALCHQFSARSVPEFSWDEWRKIERVAQEFEWSTSAPSSGGFLR